MLRADDEDRSAGLRLADQDQPIVILLEADAISSRKALVGASNITPDERRRGSGVGRWSCDGDAAKIEAMVILRANVRNGHVVLDEPTDLPEGAKVELLVLDAAAEMDATERSELEASIERGLNQTDRGELLSVEDVLARLKLI
jgi:hypothetical protein